MNSDLVNTDSIISTRNPQSSAPSPTTTQPSNFQPTLSPDVLNQSQTLEVASNGPPARAEPQTQASSAGLFVWAAILALIATALLIVWLRYQKRPAKAEEDIQELPVVKKTPQGKKKLSRSERNKRAHR